jgi:RNA-binding protein Musashi
MLSIYSRLKICLHQDEDVRYPPSRPSQGGYGAYNAYISAATRYATLGAPTLYDHPGSAYGSKSSMCYRFFCQILTHINFSSRLSISLFDFHQSGGYYGPSQAVGKKIFVGRLPQEANTDDLRQYFGRFGRIVDAYIPKVRLRLALFGIPQYIRCLNSSNFCTGPQKKRPPRFWVCHLR